MKGSPRPMLIFQVQNGMEWGRYEAARWLSPPWSSQSRWKRLKKMLASRLWMFFFRPCLATEKSRADQTPSQWILMEQRFKTWSPKMTQNIPGKDPGPKSLTKKNRKPFSTRFEPIRRHVSSPLDPKCPGSPRRLVKTLWGIFMHFATYKIF